ALEQKGVHGSMEQDEVVPGRPSGPDLDDHEKRTTNASQGPLIRLQVMQQSAVGIRLHSTGERGVSSIQKLCTEDEAGGAVRRREPRAELQFLSCGADPGLSGRR
ncbi:hypothetical protein THAOC_21291, partial [Thalassiosira oceanica]